MTGEPIITIIGNLTADPELRFTAAGAAVANGTIASTPRTFDRQTNEWKDGETLFTRFSVWRDQAENAAETLRKGMRVVAYGALKARSYTTKEGEKRTVSELDAEEIGPSLRFASAQVQRKQSGGQQQRPPQARQQRPQQQVDPWGPGQQQSYDWSNGPGDEPPF